jgi:hypothetical protein
MRYQIAQGLGLPLAVVEVEEDPPPCIYCGTSVTGPSMDGPLVCAECDCGRIRGTDGKLRKVTCADLKEWGRLRRQFIEDHKVCPAMQRMGPNSVYCSLPEGHEGAHSEGKDDG